MEIIRPEDDGSHSVPPAASEFWQESWFLGWYDPAKRAAGFHHLGLQPVRRRADVWTGIFEVSELKGPAPWHQELLGID